jgi:hypothetical protein
MQKANHDIGFWEKRQFFRRKSQKIVIITSTPYEIVKKSTKWSPTNFFVRSNVEP